MAKQPGIFGGLFGGGSKEKGGEKPSTAPAPQPAADSSASVPAVTVPAAVEPPTAKAATAPVSPPKAKPNRALVNPDKLELSIGNFQENGEKIRALRAPTVIKFTKHKEKTDRYSEEDKTFDALGDGSPNTYNQNVKHFTEMVVQAIANNPNVYALDFSNMRLGDKAITALMRGLKNHPNLRILNLTNNLIESSVRDVSDMLKANKSLADLNLSNNSLTNGNTGLDAGLGENVGLETLTINQMFFDRYNNKHSYPIAEQTAAEIFSGVGRNSTIKKLELVGDFLVGEKGKYLSDALRGHTSLEELSLAGTEIDDKSATFIAEGLSHNTSVQRATFANNKFATFGADALLRGVGKSAIRSVSFEGNDLGDGLAGLGDELPSNQSLADLNLKGCAIAGTGMNRFAKGLRNNKGLKSLTLDTARFSDSPQCIGALANALKDNHFLEELRISHMNEQDTSTLDLSQIYQALAKNDGMVRLEANENPFSDAQAIALGAGLSSNKTLRYLSLTDHSSNGCLLGDTGSIALLKGLSENSGLLYFSMLGNTRYHQVRFASTPAVTKAVIDVLKTNTTLLNLQVPRIQVPDDKLDAFVDAIAHNRSVVMLDVSDSNVHSTSTSRKSDHQELINQNTSLLSFSMPNYASNSTENHTNAQKALNDLMTRKVSSLSNDEMLFIGKRLSAVIALGLGLTGDRPLFKVEDIAHKIDDLVSTAALKGVALPKAPSLGHHGRSAQATDISEWMDVTATPTADPAQPANGMIGRIISAVAPAAALPKPKGPPQNLADWRQAEGEQPAPIYQAAVKGQFALVLKTLEATGEKLSADDLLLKHGDAPRVIEFIAKDPKLLAQVFTTEQWIGDPTGMRKVFNAVPDGAKQQVPFLELMMEVNARTAKSWAARTAVEEPAGTKAAAR